MTRTGTHHFVTTQKAMAYYHDYSPNEVLNKISNGDIAIGPPSIKDGETLEVNGEGRYIIISPTCGG